MRVLAFPRHTRSAASSRVRQYQFAEFLGKNGFCVEWRPLFDDEYLRKLYARSLFDAHYIQRICRERGRLLTIGSAYFDRLKVLTKLPQHDVVWMQHELLPWLPSAFESVLSRKLGPYVVDYDDAIFFKYENFGFQPVRGLLSTKLDVVMRHAAAVVVGNDFLKERAIKAGAKRVEILPSVVDVGAYSRVGRRPSGQITIGWIGSPTTARYLKLLKRPLERIQKDFDVTITLIGSGPFALPPMKMNIVKWSEAQETEELARFDIGIMPLENTPWEWGKCGYKIIQYMAAGLPVVASAVGANRKIVRHGETGFLAQSEDDWFNYLAQLIQSSSMREKMGVNGRAVSVKDYSIESVAPRLAQILRSAGELGTIARTSNRDGGLV